MRSLAEVKRLFIRPMQGAANGKPDVRYPTTARSRQGSLTTFASAVNMTAAEIEAG